MQVGVRLGLLGGVLAILVSIIILLVFRPLSYVTLIMALPLLGGVFALIRPDDRKALILGSLLVLAGGGLMILSGIGWLYLPSLALIGYAALVIKSPTRGTSSTASSAHPG